MPPEEVETLVAVDFRVDKRKLLGSCERVECQPDGMLWVSWYALSKPEGFVAVGGGSVYVDESRIGKTMRIDRVSPTAVDSRQTWRNCGHMFVIVLPTRYTISAPDRLPTEAKNLHKRVSVQWSSPKAPIEELHGTCGD
jgi:hypothetical protein